MKFLSLSNILILLALSVTVLVSCNSKNSQATQDQEPQVAQAQVVAEVSQDYYAISKYEDGDAICYTITKTEAISISCIPKKQ